MRRRSNGWGYVSRGVGNVGSGYETGWSLVPSLQHNPQGRLAIPSPLWSPRGDIDVSAVPFPCPRRPVPSHTTSRAPAVLGSETRTESLLPLAQALPIPAGSPHSELSASEPPCSLILYSLDLVPSVPPTRAATPHSPILKPHLHIPLRHAQLARQPLAHRIVGLGIDTEPVLEDFELFGSCAPPMPDLTS